ncbi:MAG: glycosyl transferase family 1 [Candidatus Rokuibacteriota bacterium]|nr:MAG: glycosyl transferase family 1 [Candidatus Rokubacteria bacterium]
MTAAARLEDYREVAPRGTIELLLRLADRVRGRRFVHVNAGRFGAGSPETLARLVPMMQDLGIDAAWEVMVGDGNFYAGARQLEQALAGVGPAESDLSALVGTAQANAAVLPLEADLVMTHDLATLALGRHRPGSGRWVWQYHGDLSRVPRRAWYAVRGDIERYDAAVFSLPRFAPRVSVPCLIVNPSIDPLSEKNRDLTRAEVHQVLDRLGVPRDKPILLDVTPYMKNRDPLGVLRAHRLARRYVACRLVLAGWGAGDNPEGMAVLAELREAAGVDADVHVLVLPPDATIEINALQRAATVVVHVPRQEDFGLLAAEAMWKGKPVVASLAGGLSTQVITDVTGYTVTSVEGAALRIRQLLEDPDLVGRLGGAAREYVRRSFLITRHLGDYLALLASLTG